MGAMNLLYMCRIDMPQGGLGVKFEENVDAVSRTKGAVEHGKIVDGHSGPGYGLTSEWCEYSHIGGVPRRSKTSI